MTGLSPTMVFVLTVIVFFVVAAGVLFVLWIATPFSVFGVKGLLGRLAEEQAETNRLLREISAALKAGRGPGGEGPGKGPGEGPAG